MDKNSTQETDSFYEALGPIADKIFPLSVRTTAFLEELFDRCNTKSLLDLACGSGELACHFALRGMRAVGLDVVPAMIRAARKRSMETGAGVMFVEADMVDLDEKEVGSFDAITCLGNSVVHLEDLDDALEFLKTCVRHIEPGGMLAVQTVNMDAFLAQGKMDFPRLSGMLPNGVEATLDRSYSLLPSREHLIFETKLTVGAESHKHETLLLCMTRDQLIGLFSKAGFTTIEGYGDYQKSAWTQSSPATIVVGFLPK